MFKSSRNVFTVRPLAGGGAAREGAAFYECRIKGKILRNQKDAYNPLAPGDIVFFEPDDGQGTGMITGVQPRRTCFTRFNLKGSASQLLASNVDRIVCVGTPVLPPFRPRFIDRVLVQAEAAGIPASIVLNKTDLRGASAHREAEEAALAARLNDFIRCGYPVLEVSAATGAGIEALRRHLARSFSVFIGQSGVGKSSLINALCPGAGLKIGTLNEKYDRGNHTTVQAGLITGGEGQNAFALIDTPGVRQFIPDGVTSKGLVAFMKEFIPFAEQCAFGLSCSHRGEQGCRVKKAVDDGDIHPDRYESFLRITDDLRSREEGRYE